MLMHRFLIHANFIGSNLLKNYYSPFDTYASAQMLIKKE